MIIVKTNLINKCTVKLFFDLQTWFFREAWGASLGNESDTWDGKVRIEKKKILAARSPIYSGEILRSAFALLLLFRDNEEEENQALTKRTLIFVG